MKIFTTKTSYVVLMISMLNCFFVIHDVKSQVSDKVAEANAKVHKLNDKMEILLAQQGKFESSINIGEKKMDEMEIHLKELDVALFSQNKALAYIQELDTSAAVKNKLRSCKACQEVVEQIQDSIMYAEQEYRKEVRTYAKAEIQQQLHKLNRRIYAKRQECNMQDCMVLIEQLPKAAEFAWAKKVVDRVVELRAEIEVLKDDMKNLTAYLKGKKVMLTTLNREIASLSGELTTARQERDGLIESYHSEKEQAKEESIQTTQSSEEEKSLTKEDMKSQKKAKRKKRNNNIQNAYRSK